MTTVGFLGTGIMGVPMARNLARAGFDVRAWNRTRDKAEPLAEDGVTVAGSPAEAAQGADVLVTMLADADAVAEAVRDVRDVPVWAQMSTVGIKPTERLAGMAGERDMTYVDAPVLGTKQPAERAQLVVVAAGPEDVRDRVEPLFGAVGRATQWVGQTPGDATRLKVVLNHWILALTENIGETVAFAQAIGVDPRLALGAIEGGNMDTPYLHMKANAILEEALEAAFPLRLAVKDADLVLDAGREGGIELPLIEVARRQFARAVELGHGDEDMAATYFATASETGATGAER
ncbi:MAG TPA: NAD(P)-dependent oxidoreductase [Solirubrobacteraceae bacterium]|nr:NAD(P)-dependent oxidoreductase [Solirubrobacteraceae bacterium]